jgi:hypothetical protein
VSLLINGQRVPASVLSSEEEEGVRPEAILRQIAAGATLLIEHIQWCSTPLSALCRDLERSFGAAVSINLYLTPESSQGFLFTSTFMMCSSCRSLARRFGGFTVHR